MRMKHISILTAVFALVFAVDAANAEPKKKRGNKGKKQQLKEMTITGTVTKQEKKRGKKLQTTYVLTDDAGTKINLPSPKGKKGKNAQEQINLDEYVDAKVKIVGKGKEQKKGKKTVVNLRKILSIEKMENGDDAGAPAEEGGDDMGGDAGDDAGVPAEEGGDDWNF